MKTRFRGWQDDREGDDDRCWSCCRICGDLQWCATLRNWESLHALQRECECDIRFGFRHLVPCLTRNSMPDCENLTPWNNITELTFIVDLAFSNKRLPPSFHVNQPRHHGPVKGEIFDDCACLLRLGSWFIMCYLQGTTRFLLTKIPHFREVSASLPSRWFDWC